MADDSKHDLTSIGNVAVTRAERRMALDACMTQFWLNEDIVRLERRDEDGWSGWDMWRRRPNPNPPGGG